MVRLGPPIGSSARCLVVNEVTVEARGAAQAIAAAYEQRGTTT
ncbi:hypothetical protein [Yinghuangia aomiensis]